MYEIYATEMVCEQCSADKNEINMVIPYAVFHFVLSGEGYINGKKITKDTVFISFENNRMHYYPSRENPWQYIYMRLSGSEVRKAFADHGFELGLTVLPFHKKDALFKILSLHESFSDSANTDSRKIVANSVFLLFDRKRNSVKIQSKQEEHAEQIKRYIDESYYKKITVESIASKFFLNKNYVRTVFVKYFGISPKQYIQKLRMERAVFLLLNTEEDISLVAKSVGYDDSLLFSKMFKSYHKCSPAQYRSQYLNKTEKI